MRVDFATDVKWVRRVESGRQHMLQEARRKSRVMELRKGGRCPPDSSLQVHKLPVQTIQHGSIASNGKGLEFSRDQRSASTIKRYTMANILALHHTTLQYSAFILLCITHIPYSIYCTLPTVFTQHNYIHCTTLHTLKNIKCLAYGTYGTYVIHTCNIRDMSNITCVT